MRWLAGLAEAVLLAAAVGACSSSASSISVSPMSGTETLIGTMTGAAAARWLNSYGGAPPTVTGRSGTTCYFRLDGGTGTYTVLGSESTGRFAGATGHGTYALTILTEASMLPDKTFCDLLSGNVSAKGTSVTFKASGPLTLKP
jgi:hypothetical protein